MLAACARGQAPPVLATAPEAAPSASLAPPPVHAPAPAESGSLLVAPPSTPAAEPAPPADRAASPLPRGTTLLHIGDSMAGALGIELDRLLEQQGIKGVLRYRTASFIPNWAWGDELGLYLAQYHPDLVLISLGTNEIEIQDPGRRAPTVEKLVGRLGGLPCVWLLPPVWAGGPNNGLGEVIRQHAAPCVCVDQEEIFPGMPRVGDKIHPTMAARKEWARRVLEWLGAHRRPAAGRPWEIGH